MGRQGKREINAGFDVSWTRIPAKSARNQTPFAASLSSATSPSQPSSSTLFKSTATQSPEIITSYSATSKLLWSVLKMPLYSTVTCRWYLSATRGEGAIYPEAFVHLLQRQSSRTDISYGPAASRCINAEVAFSRQQWCKGKWSPSTCQKENAYECTELCSMRTWILTLVVAPFSFLGNENKSESQHLFCVLLV